MTNATPSRVHARVHRIAVLILAAILLAACGSSRNAVTLPLQPIPYVDTLPSLRPEERQPNEVVRLLKISVGGEIGYGLSLRRMLGKRHEAINVTSFDDVVNSAWFQHRIDRGDMTVENVARGPTTAGPDTSRALTVIGGKAAGISPGFTVRDANGTTFLFKFDPKGNLYLASAADVISDRLLYAAGYYVPEDYIVVFDSSQLVVDPGAEITVNMKKRKMTRADIGGILSLTDTLPDGRFLALASKFVPGKPLGPFFFNGVRKDDANDYYYHEYRRDLRGLYVISSWLNHVDMRFANTLDVWIDPPGYVRHYLIDFAATLGSGTIGPHQPREGTEYNFAFWPSLARVLTLGFYKKGWEDQEYEILDPAIGWMPLETFQPGAWRANWPNAAFSWATPADGYWGAKLVARFTDEQIRAAIGQGQLPRREASEILERILIARRDKIIRYWYGKVTPIEDVEAHFRRAPAPGLDVSFADLGLEAGVWTGDRTSYSWEFEDVYLKYKATGESDASGGNRQTLRIGLDELDTDLAAISFADASATLRVTAKRNGGSVGREAVIYLRWEGSANGFAVVGLRH